MVCHCLDKFGSHTYRDSRNTKFTDCHLMKYDNVSKGPGDYDNWSPSR